jgi:hypothetical protein
MWTWEGCEADGPKPLFVDEDIGRGQVSLTQMLQTSAPQVKVHLKIFIFSWDGHRVKKCLVFQDIVLG